jgi:hypothetical protein
MAHQPAPPTLRCTDCAAEVTVEQYRRKRPRCDDCEVAAAMRQFEVSQPPTRPAAPRWPQRLHAPRLHPNSRTWKLRLRLLSLQVRLECGVKW